VDVELSSLDYRCISDHCGHQVHVSQCSTR
jgi:hypothetical protein